jgi:AraC-like DNA-binding protein
MLLFIENYHLKRRVCITTTNMPLPLGFSFCVSGCIQWKINGMRKRFVTETGSYELLYTDHTAGISQAEASAPVMVVNIMLCPQLLQTYLDKPFERALGVDLHNTPTSTCDPVYTKHAISSAAKHILGQLVHAPCNSMVDSLFIQGKVLELVAIQLGQHNPAGDSLDARRFSADETDMAAQAVAILRSRLQSPPSLPRLARLLGTNETKLKRSFKSRYGTTVFGYVTACRMEQACELLADDRLTMAQIAAELGYAERTHFSRAFARYFGIPPSQYRLNMDAPPSPGQAMKLAVPGGREAGQWQ